MPQSNKTIETRVLNTSISVVANDENEAKILEITTFVKEKLDNLKKRNPMTNSVQVAVLGCMNVTELFFDEREKHQSAKKRVNVLNEENQALNEELQKAEDACQLLMNEVTQLHEEQKNLQTERLDQDLIIQEKNGLLEELWGQLQTAKTETEDCRDQITALQEQQQVYESAMAEKEAYSKRQQEQLAAANAEIDRCRKSMVDLQNQLFEAQIELDKLKNEG